MILLVPVTLYFAQMANAGFMEILLAAAFIIVNSNLAIS